MKICGKCKRTLPLHRFHRHRDDYQSWCKECKAKYAAAYYQRTRDARVTVNRQYRERSYEWYFALKAGKPCADCGGVFHPVAMEWDHRPGTTKLGNIATLQRGRRSILIEELEKCDLICANCHAVRTYARHRAA